MILGMILLKKLREAMVSVLPVSAIVLVLYLTPLVDLTPKELTVFLVSTVTLILGIALFNLGADLAMTPMGEQVGSGLTRMGSIKLLLSVAFLMGVFITIAEPDLSALAGQIGAVVNGTLLIAAVGIGVGLFLVLSILKMAFQKSLSSILLFFYFLAFAVTAMVITAGNAAFLPLSFDSGGVTTGPITVPFIMALGIGIAGSLGGKNAKENSFGLIAMCSIGPILAVLLLGITIQGDISYTVPDNYVIADALGSSVLHTLLHTLKEVGIALGLIVAFFALLQVFVLHLPRRKLGEIAVGILYTFFGLVLFLGSATIGFMPVGYRLGMELAENPSPYLLGFALILGMVVVLAEPAVHVLKNQVEEVTDGLVSRSSMMIALSIGVGISLCLSMLRIVFDFSILYYLIPGYALSLGLSFFVPGLYTAIAFDSGGVASGPLTSTFILPFAVGACCTLLGESSVMSSAFGIVAMVAMTPLITIQLLGFRAVVTKKVRDNIAMRRILGSDDEQIINFM